MELVPAILTTDEDFFKEKVGVLGQVVRRIQIDVADGGFVEERTLGLKDLRILVGEDDWGIKFDYHLMVRKPEEWLEVCQWPGTNLFLFQVEADGDFRSLIEAVTSFGVKVGIVVNPGTGVGRAEPFLNEIEALQVMTVRPGAQGRKFLSSHLEKIVLLRKMGFEGEILVDGGINHRTIGSVLKLAERPDTVCVGSYILKSDDPVGRFEKLKDLIF